MHKYLISDLSNLRHFYFVGCKWSELEPFWWFVKLDLLCKNGLFWSYIKVYYGLNKQSLYAR